jgi:hypothetical protein
MNGKKFLIWKRIATIMGREGDMTVVGQISFVDTRKPAIFFYEIVVRGSLHMLAEKGSEGIKLTVGFKPKSKLPNAICSSVDRDSTLRVSLMSSVEKLLMLGKALNIAFQVEALT